jgi:hypothetical protein
MSHVSRTVQRDYLLCLEPFSLIITKPSAQSNQQTPTRAYLSRNNKRQRLHHARGQLVTSRNLMLRDLQ